MSSKTRVQRLEHWLVDALKIPMENFSVSIEHGEVTAEFTDTPQYGPFGDPEISEEGTEVAIEWSFDQVGFEEKVSMKDRFLVNVIIRNYEKSSVLLKVGLLRWLYQENQEAFLTYSQERNNHQTYDYFFELEMTEKSFNKDGCDGIVTC